MEQQREGKTKHERCRATNQEKAQRRGIERGGVSSSVESGKVDVEHSTRRLASGGADESAGAYSAVVRRRGTRCCCKKQSGRLVAMVNGPSSDPGLNLGPSAR